MSLRWPWVSRLAFDAVSAERDRLLAENARLLDHVTRMERADRGLSEVPRQPRPPMEPMPRDLAEHIAGYDNPTVRVELRRTCFRRARNESWDAIKADVMPRKGEESPLP